MFMNSPNRDPDFVENPETNKFAFIDRYMIDFKSWNKTLNEIEKVDS